MFGYVRGTVLSTRPVVVLCDGGFGLLVHSAVDVAVDEEIALWLSPQTRQDATLLYGFATTADRDLFEALLRVSGVGPTSAIALVRDVGRADIARAVVESDPSPLLRAKGVGKRAAGVIVSTLTLPDGPVEDVNDVDGRWREIAEAVAALGFDEERARVAVKELCGAMPESDDAEIISAAFTKLRMAHG